MPLQVLDTCGIERQLKCASSYACVSRCLLKGLDGILGVLCVVLRYLLALSRNQILQELEARFIQRFCNNAEGFVGETTILEIPNH